MVLNFAEYSENCHDTARYPQMGRSAGFNYVILGLCGEVGEAVNKYKKVIRDEAGLFSEEVKQKILAEFGDCLWYLSMAAWELGSSLEEVAIQNMHKLRRRVETGKIGGEGDDR